MQSTNKSVNCCIIKFHNKKEREEIAVMVGGV